MLGYRMIWAHPAKVNELPAREQFYEQTRAREPPARVDL